MIPLAYVIRIDPQVPGLAPTLAPNQPHSTEHGSVESDLIARASHTLQTRCTLNYYFSP